SWACGREVSQVICSALAAIMHDLSRGLYERSHAAKRGRMRESVPIPLAEASAPLGPVSLYPATVRAHLSIIVLCDPFHEKAKKMPAHMSNRSVTIKPVGKLFSRTLV